MTSFLKEAYKKSRNFALRRSDIEVLVRDATSNEKWGPSGTQMSQIAMATHNYNDFNVIMNTLWERLNDDGKNWRHIYKALLVIDYLLRNGSERVIAECRARIIEIKTLTEFQRVSRYDKDVGLSVRERAKQIVELLNDEKRLQAEREKASKNRDKYTVAMTNDSAYYRQSAYQPQSTGPSESGDIPTAPVTSFRTRRSSRGSSPGRNNAPKTSPRNRSVSAESDSVDSADEHNESSSASGSDDVGNNKRNTQTKSQAPATTTTTSNATRQTTSMPRRPSGGKRSNITAVTQQTSNANVNNPPPNTVDPLFELLTSSSPPKQSSTIPTFSTNSTFNMWAPLSPSAIPSGVSAGTMPASNIATAPTSFNPRLADDDWADFTKASISTTSTTASNMAVNNTNLSVDRPTNNVPNDPKVIDPWRVKPDLIELDLNPSGNKTDPKSGATSASYRPMGAASNMSNLFLAPTMTTTPITTTSSLPVTTAPPATMTAGYSGIGTMYNTTPTMAMYPSMYTYTMPTTTATTTSPGAASNPSRYPTSITNSSIGFRN
jgi:hypothetical protein